MANLIIVRLTPVTPTSGTDFTNYLANLDIKAFDLSFADSVAGVLVGQASGLLTPLGKGNVDLVTSTAPRIIQHFSLIKGVPKPEAVATAVIVLNPPAGHAEASGSDIRLEITNGGLALLNQRVDFNVTTVPPPPPATLPITYTGLPASLYFSIPDPATGLAPTVAHVTMPSDGTAPSYAELLQAVNLVLGQDPGPPTDTLAQLSPLTAAQARLVAYEISWNRSLLPLPVPTLRLEDLYTRPPTDPTVTGNLSDADSARQQFEAKRDGYYATTDAQADRLANYVLAISAAIWAETQSANALLAQLTFPIDPSAVPGGAVINEADVALVPGGGFGLPFIVPAPYFYALGAGMAPSVDAQQRFQNAAMADEQQNISDIQHAIDAGVIAVQPITPVQAARRLSALGVRTDTGLPQCPLNADIAPLLQGWLAFTGPDIEVFWAANVSVFPKGHVELVLSVVTKQKASLIAAILAIPIAGITNLKALTTADWNRFFLPANTALLPDFTRPGTPQERVVAFIRQLRKYFPVDGQTGAPPAATPLAPLSFGIAVDDPIAAFVAAYNGLHPTPPLVFGTAIDQASYDQALLQVFPADAEARAWLDQVLRSIGDLAAMTEGIDATLQFSLMEALYARGFTSMAAVQLLSLAEFQEALTGTVAYEHAQQIYTNAGGNGGGSQDNPGPFTPVNPDGSLVNCIPPWYLSPFGPVAYLNELLKVSDKSTCDDPASAIDGQRTLGTVIAGRRGPLGNLHATVANLETALPAIDLVNESLEALASGLASGAVYDTNADQLGGHPLRSPLEEAEHDDDGNPYRHDPVTMFAAIPEHSTPACPVGQPHAYELLRSDFSSPHLPYSQPLDVSRSYLHQLGTSRFAAMRRFRKDITEFVGDPALEPADFQRHLWRYPVRFDIAREYLGISPEEYSLLYTQNAGPASTQASPAITNLFGFGAGPDNQSLTVPEFLTSTGLSYCEFLELWQSKYVAFGAAGTELGFPECEPCCPEDLRIQFNDAQGSLEPLHRLAVFIRLWRTMQGVRGARYTFRELCDICLMLDLFLPDGSVNPDFIRQLAAFQMLRDDFDLALGVREDAPAGATGADRTRLLALWAGPASANWNWAVEHLLDRIEDSAEDRRACEREPELMKAIQENLDPLSGLVGFNPAGTDTWHAQPASTLRFAEVLLKIYLSDFSVGEIVFLFTVDPHLDGDDPFPEEGDTESLDMPLAFPEGDDEHTLWALRQKLLCVEVSEEQCGEWSWHHIVNSLRDEFGYVPGSGPDPLQSLGEHFFPDILAHHGSTPALATRRYRVALAGSNAAMWNTPPHGPFQYDNAAQELSIGLPLRDERVAAKLSHMRPLTQAEQDAVGQLYFSPRADLAPFAMIFSNFTEAERILIEEEDERRRWHYFRDQFARFHARCHIIAEHLARHVSAATDGECIEERLAWDLLRSLFADENRGTTPFEQDSGQPPAAHLWPQPGGGAFAALLGLTGTGLLGQFTSETGAPIWNEVRGPMCAFGEDRNERDTPFPTVLPSMGLSLPPDQLKFAVLRNGFAVRDADGEPLGGAQGFQVRWSGVLIVETAGHYEFLAGTPTEHGSEPDCEDAGRHRWRVTVQRGQKTWIVLNRRWPGEEAPDAHSAPLSLKRGAYTFTVEFAQRAREFDEDRDARRGRAGFEVKYKGPDSDDELTAIPLHRLFRDVKNATLGAGLKVVAAAQDFLDRHYTSSLRDIRRTYKRAFAGLLFAHRFELSARLMVGHSQSEIGYLLAHAANFLGTSYYPIAGPAYQSHHAYFDFNFLPVRDAYYPPPVTDDDRVGPSLQRRQALFDWWERIFDYAAMRGGSRSARERPAWLLFLEAAENQPDTAELLVRYLGIDTRHAAVLLRVYQGYALTAADLEDERWAVRVWHGEKWIRALLHHFVPLDFDGWRPDLWASDDPGAVLTGETESGNTNLTRVYQDGCFENGEPRRYADLKLLNDGLRERARAALLAFLCGMNRVALPWGTNLFAKTPQDLSDLLLQDVQVGLPERSSRIEEAITVVQTFVERARLGLEPGFTITPAFLFAWDRLFATFHTWQACQRRKTYRETYVEWVDLEKARPTEAYRFLDSELRRSALTFPVPGGQEYWPGNRPAPHPSIALLQNREPSHLRIIPQPENLGLMGAPERDAPTWLAPIPGTKEVIANNLNIGGVSTVPPDTQGLPLWVQAAIRLGVRFLRIAAAGDPPASSEFKPRDSSDSPCCACCGKVHAPVMDEYYFWLVDAKFYAAQTQDADWGTTPLDPTSDWERDDKLPALLSWPAQPMVRLGWCRVHYREFQPARRSDDGVHVTATGNPQLLFLGRTGDSLQFSVTDAAPIPAGYSDPSPWGFRYDMVPDTAVVLPDVVAAPLPPPSVGGLSAYPFFSYYTPGAPLEPSSWFTPAITVAGALRAHCRYEAALKWYELYYKPLDSDNRWARCSDIRTGAGAVGAVEAPRPDDPCCQTELVSDDLAHQRAILLHYLETLAQFGDSAMCCTNSPEGFQKARLIFDTMARILGRRPTTTASRDDAASPQTVALFVPRFAPLNPRLMALYDLVDERLSLIHHGLNKRRLRNGKLHVDTSYWGNSPIRGGWRTEEGPCEAEDDCCCPRSPYRFLFVLSKALEVSGDVRALGAELLAAYEKEEAELLADLRATHERQLLNRTLEVRENEWRSADWEVQALQKGKEGALARLQYYSDLIANGLITNEQLYESLTSASMITRAAGNLIEALTSTSHLVPDPYAGTVTFLGLPGGSKIANSLNATARISYALADITGTLASLDLTEAGWDRRLQEWVQQVTVIRIEIEQIQRQILGAERRRDAALRQLNNHRLQMEQSAEIQDFLRDKFTSDALYLYLQQETAALHHQMYELALCWAHQAQHAYNLERGHTARRFLPESAWDNLHEGLLAGERLQLALRQMEKSFLDLNTREYELTKHVSLRMSFPLELLRLQATGSCEIDIPEWMFDLDYPGHMMRRFKYVGVSIPCVTGAYTEVHCRLTLLRSTTRIDSSLRDVNHCCPDCGLRNGYATLPDDPRVVCQYAALEAVATSGVVNDTGMFELNFRDERYLPFEYAGVVSRWRVELRAENNQFDIDSVSDVVLHLNYTAWEGGDVLRRAANDMAQRHLSDDGVRYFDMASDFSEAWQIFQSQSTDDDCDRTLALRLKRGMFPFLPGDRPVEVKRLELFFEASCPQPGNSHVVDFLVEHRHGEQHCECEVRKITCTASAEWPCFFHGVLDQELKPLEHHGHRDVGAFRFQSCAGQIRRAYLICGYQALEMERCEPFRLPVRNKCEEIRKET